jgi:hypothetical protein
MRAKEVMGDMDPEADNELPDGVWMKLLEDGIKPAWDEFNGPEGNPVITGVDPGRLLADGDAPSPMTPPRLSNMEGGWRDELELDRGATAIDPSEFVLLCCPEDPNDELAP